MPPQHRPRHSVPHRREVLGAAVVLTTLGAAAAAALPPLRGAMAQAGDTHLGLEAFTLSDQWLNCEPLGPQALRGKVVVTAFWTYSCINSLRVLPYLRAWQATYAKHGLVVIGVHTPEFNFETNRTNVRNATRLLGVEFPVVMDNDHRIWRAFNNDAWPAFYFIDANGRVRGRQIGEGAYDEAERQIRRLLSQTGATIPPALSAVTGTGPEAAPDFASLRSPETYVGYALATRFASPGGLRRAMGKAYRSPGSLLLNQWSLSGEWKAGEEFATLVGPSGGLAYRFHARDLHMVLAPPKPHEPVRFRVRIDGTAPGIDHGWDTAPDGTGMVREPRMYQLVRLAGPVTDRTFEVEFLDPGVRAYVFTFG